MSNEVNEYVAEDCKQIIKNERLDIASQTPYQLGLTETSVSGFIFCQTTV